jgi:hypothetical protein
LAFYGCSVLKDFIILTPTAPSVNGTPFGSYSTVAQEWRGEIGANTKGVGNNLWTSFGATGYDAAAYTNRLLAATGCAYTMRAYGTSGVTIYVSFNGGSDIGAVRGTSTSDEVWDGVYMNSGEYAGCYRFYVGNGSVIHQNETVTFSVGGTNVGKIRYDYGVNRYVAENVMGTRGIFGIPSEDENATISMSEYNKLSAKVNQLTDIINDILNR